MLSWVALATVISLQISNRCLKLMIGQSIKLQMGRWFRCFHLFMRRPRRISGRQSRPLTPMYGDITSFPITSTQHSPLNHSNDRLTAGLATIRFIFSITENEKNKKLMAWHGMTENFIHSSRRKFSNYAKRNHSNVLQSHSIGRSRWCNITSDNSCATFVIGMWSIRNTAKFYVTAVESPAPDREVFHQIPHAFCFCHTIEAFYA